MHKISFTVYKRTNSRTIFLPVSNLCLNVVYVYPKSTFEKNGNINETMPTEYYEYKFLVLWCTYQKHSISWKKNPLTALCSCYNLIAYLSWLSSCLSTSPVPIFKTLDTSFKNINNISRSGGYGKDDTSNCFLSSDV